MKEKYFISGCKTKSEKRKWVRVIIEKLKEKGIDIENYKFIFLTPRYYWQWIVERLHLEGGSTDIFLLHLPVLLKEDRLVG